MKYFPVSIVLISLFLIASCDKAPSKVQSAPATTNSQPQTTNTTTSSNNGNKQVKINPKHGEPGHTCAVPEGAPIPDGPVEQTPVIKTELVPGTQNPPTNLQSTPTVAAGMNPQHGQPGHRCDIPVGAPLNSKPVQ